MNTCVLREKREKLTRSIQPAKTKEDRKRKMKRRTMRVEASLLPFFIGFHKPTTIDISFLNS